MLEDRSVLACGDDTYIKHREAIQGLILNIVPGFDTTEINDVVVKKTTVPNLIGITTGVRV